MRHEFRVIPKSHHAFRVRRAMDLPKNGDGDGAAPAPGKTGIARQFEIACHLHAQTTDHIDGLVITEYLIQAAGDCAGELLAGDAVHSRFRRTGIADAAVDANTVGQPPNGTVHNYASWWGIRFDHRLTGPPTITPPDLPRVCP